LLKATSKNPLEKAKKTWYNNNGDGNEKAVDNKWSRHATGTVVKVGGSARKAEQSDKLGNVSLADTETGTKRRLFQRRQAADG
jgi:hypothetical protein